MTDRRIQRTRELLKDALMQLIAEKGYDSVTIQDITEKANLGRTTFYLHYESKEALLLDHHFDFASHLILRPLTYEELVNEIPPVDFETFLKSLQKDKSIYFAVAHSKDSGVIMRGVRQQMVNNLIISLKPVFVGRDLSLELLANYIVGAQLSFIDWWLSTHTDCSAAEAAKLLHDMQRAAIERMYDES